MDQWTAFVALTHLKLRVEILQRNPVLLHTLLQTAQRETDMATPKLQSLSTAMAQLEHNLEFGAGKLLDKIGAVGARGDAAMTKGHVKMDGIGTRVAEVESFVAALEGANGGDPLDSSAPSSDPQVTAEQPKGPNGGPRIL